MDLAESESEKEQLKYSIVKSSGLSSSKAKQWYGFQDVNRRIVKVQDPAEKAHNIRVAIERIAHIKEQALVEALGIALSSESETSESESEEESEKAESTSEIIQIKKNSASENTVYLVPRVKTYHVVVVQLMETVKWPKNMAQNYWIF